MTSQEETGVGYDFLHSTVIFQPYCFLKVFNLFLCSFSNEDCVIYLPHNENFVAQMIKKENFHCFPSSHLFPGTFTFISVTFFFFYCLIPTAFYTNIHTVHGRIDAFELSVGEDS